CCHKGVFFKSKLDEAKEKLSCLGGCLVALLAVGVLCLLSTYSVRPPWRYGWSPIYRPEKPKEEALDAISITEQAAAAVAAEEKAVGEQKELLEKMAAALPEERAKLHAQARILERREDELAL